MIPVKTNDPRLSQTAQRTFSVLLSNGSAIAGRHNLTAFQANAMNLSAANFRELVGAGLATVTDVPGGQIVRPMTAVATAVEFFDNGDISVTLALDLA